MACKIYKYKRMDAGENDYAQKIGKIRAAMKKEQNDKVKN